MPKMNMRVSLQEFTSVRRLFSNCRAMGEINTLGAQHGVLDVRRDTENIPITRDVSCLAQNRDMEYELHATLKLNPFVDSVDVSINIYYRPALNGSAASSVEAIRGSDTFQIPKSLARDPIELFERGSTHRLFLIMEKLSMRFNDMIAVFNHVVRSDLRIGKNRTLSDHLLNGHIVEAPHFILN